MQCYKANREKSVHKPVVPEINLREAAQYVVNTEQSFEIENQGQFARSLELENEFGGTGADTTIENSLVMPTSRKTTFRVFDAKRMSNRQGGKVCKSINYAKELYKRTN